MGDEFEDSSVDTSSDMSDSGESFGDSSMDAGDEPIEDSGSEGLDDSTDSGIEDSGESFDDSSMDAGDEAIEDSSLEGLDDSTDAEESVDESAEAGDESAEGLPDSEEDTSDVEEPIVENADPAEDSDMSPEEEEMAPDTDADDLPDGDAEGTDESADRSSEMPNDGKETPTEDDEPTEGADEPVDENAKVGNDDGTDWERTSLRPGEEAQLREMDETGEIDIPEENPNWQEPIHKEGHLPTDKTGTFEGDRGESAFHPNDDAALNKMNEVGRDSVDYQNGNPDFSPFTQYDTPYGKMDGQVEIPHMTDNRENPSWEYGRRPIGTSHDPNYDLGNFAQADNALSEKMGNMTPEQVEDYRKANNLTWHECPDGKTMQLVPTEIHDACRHSGGVSEQKYRQAMGDITAPSY